MTTSTEMEFLNINFTEDSSPIGRFSENHTLCWFLKSILNKSETKKTQEDSKWCPEISTTVKCRSRIPSQSMRLVYETQQNIDNRRFTYMQLL
jgi:hypothetical protein